MQSATCPPPTDQSMFSSRGAKGVKKNVKLSVKKSVKNAVK
jgi:hypothetical protein